MLILCYSGRTKFHRQERSRLHLPWGNAPIVPQQLVLLLSSPPIETCAFRKNGSPSAHVPRCRSGLVVLASVWRCESRLTSIPCLCREVAT